MFTYLSLHTPSLFNPVSNKYYCVYSQMMGETYWLIFNDFFQGRPVPSIQRPVSLISASQIPSKCIFLSTRMSVRLPNIHYITPYVHDNNATVNMEVHIFVLYGKSKGLSLKIYNSHVLDILWRNLLILHSTHIEAVFLMGSDFNKLSILNTHVLFENSQSFIIIIKLNCLSTTTRYLKWLLMAIFL